MRKRRPGGGGVVQLASERALLTSIASGYQAALLHSHRKPRWRRLIARSLQKERARWFAKPRAARCLLLVEVQHGY